MWEIPDYRDNSPGEKSVNDFLSRNPKRGTLFDLGCGTGRSTQKLISAGFDATGVDIANNCLDEQVPFIWACLWSRDFKADWIYCCDVMEHIPTHHVDEVLNNMNGDAYLRIFLKPDRFGKEIGSVLHLTVKPFEWWEEKIINRWRSVESSSTDVVATFYCRNRNGSTNILTSG